MRPSTGQSTFTIAGEVSLTRAAVTIQHAVFSGNVRFQATADGVTVEDSRLLSFSIESGGVDGFTMRRSVLDGECRIGQNFVYGATNFRFLGNTFRNYHVCANEALHSEAMFIGALSNGGLIEGNTFVDNGTTGHLFFTWFDGTPGVDHPRNICVRGNTFIRSLNGYYHVQARSEIPDSSNISIDPSNVKGESIPGFDTMLTSAFARSC